MTKCILTVGIQGSGKSFWSEQYIKQNKNFKRINRDLLRHNFSAYTFDNENEKLVEKAVNCLIKLSLEEGYSIILDEMHLNKNNLNKQIGFIKSIKPDIEIEIKEFPISLEQAIERDSKRDFVIGEEIIRKTWKKYERELNDMLERGRENKKTKDDPNLPYCIVCDVDFTLAIRGNRSPYDFSKVNEDKVNKPIRALLNILGNTIFNSKKELTKIFIFSSRDDSCELSTTEWLKENTISFDALIMRETGDKRKDAIVKKEMFEKHIQGKYNCVYWIDDRKQVIDMARNELGLTVLDVAGNEF